MQLTDMTELTTQLLTISAITKIFVDLMKLKLKEARYASQIKVVASYILPIIMTVFLGISLFETGSEVAFYVGTVLAGVVAGLGSTFIHEILKALQTLKGLKK